MSDVGGTQFYFTHADLAVGLPLPRAAELVAIYGNLGTTGSTNTTFQANKNGSAVTGASVVLGSGVAKANKIITNPNIGVNAGNSPSPWTDQAYAANPSIGAFNSSGGPLATPPLATFAAGDTVSLTTTLGTSAANPGVVFAFQAI
jgi:hypothetical protein